MKTAWESYFETITEQEKLKILAEQERKKYFKEADIAPILEVIQQEINIAIKNRQFHTAIKFVEDGVYTKFNGIIYCWHLLNTNTIWSNYNKITKCYYNIPRIPITIISIDSICQALSEAGYNYSIQETQIKEATSKTGKYFITRKAKEIIINWNNELFKLGENINE